MATVTQHRGTQIGEGSAALQDKPGGVSAPNLNWLGILTVSCMKRGGRLTTAVLDLGAAVVEELLLAGRELQGVLWVTRQGGCQRMARSPYSTTVHRGGPFCVYAAESIAQLVYAAE